MLGSARSLAPALAALALAFAAAVVLGPPLDVGRVDAPRIEALLCAGQSPQGTANAAANDLIYHGGNLGSGAIGVETQPAVYLIYWGQEWASGYTIADTDGTLYSSKTLQNYLNSFFANVGGSPWAGVQTQYCRGVLAGSTSCAGTAGQFITNPKHQLKGV
jgi:serine protease